jgi:hypothetical protein
MKLVDRVKRQAGWDFIEECRTLTTLGKQLLDLVAGELTDEEEYHLAQKWDQMRGIHNGLSDYADMDPLLDVVLKGHCSVIAGDYLLTLLYGDDLGRDEITALQAGWTKVQKWETIIRKEDPLVVEVFENLAAGWDGSIEDLLKSARDISVRSGELV